MQDALQSAILEHIATHRDEDGIWLFEVSNWGQINSLVASLNVDAQELLEAFRDLFAAGYVIAELVVPPGDQLVPVEGTPLSIVKPSIIGYRLGDLNEDHETEDAEGSTDDPSSA